MDVFFSPSYENCGVCVCVGLWCHMYIDRSHAFLKRKFEIVRFNALHLRKAEEGFNT